MESLIHSSLDTWYKWVAVIGGTFVIVATVAGAARGFWHMSRAAVKVSDALPTLLGMAAEFRPNGGNSLHDNIVKIRDEQTRVAHALSAHQEAMLSALARHTQDDEVRFNRLEVALVRTPPPPDAVVDVMMES
jgi:hypothetical protein